jgi:FlaA1/EpsC-like NDP-sugar epimerase
VFEGKSILITGGTGSFGQRLTQTLLEQHKPRRIAIYSRDELKQYEMAQKFSSPEMRYFIGGIRDRGDCLLSIQAYGNFRNVITAVRLRICSILNRTAVRLA